MKRIRSFTAFTAASAALSLLLAGCAGGAPSTTTAASGQESGNITIAIVSKGFQHQFWQQVKAGAEDAAKELGISMTFEGPDTESNVQQQVTQLQTALGTNPSAIALAALDSQAVAPMLEQAKSQNIPVVAFDSGVESEIPVTTVATDNKAAAALAAQKMADAIGHEGEIAMIVQDQTSKSAQDRRDGFTDYLNANEPNIKVVDIQYGGGDQAKSADLTKTILQANPNIKGIYGSNEGSAIGVVQAVKELGTQGVVVVGFDSGKAQIDAITSGLEYGAVTQDPKSIGRETVKAAYSAIKGEKLAPTIGTEFHWYDKNNIKDETIQAAIYE